MNHPRIAFFPIVRVQFDVPLAEQMIQAARENLQKAGFELVGPQKPVSDLASVQAALAELTGKDVDLALVFQATFADSSMVSAIADALDAPIFLWAVPEAWTGGRLRLNSLCGTNLAGHALTLRGRKFDYAYAQPGDESHDRPGSPAGRGGQPAPAAEIGPSGGGGRASHRDGYLSPG